MYDTGKYVQDKSEQNKSSSKPGSNVVAIPKIKKANRNRQQHTDKAQVHVLPLSNKPFPLQDVGTVVPLRVLLVNNSLNERRACQELFRRSSDLAIELVEAESGEEGVALVKAGAFDCVMIDNILPDMDVAEFFERFSRVTDVQSLFVLKLVAPSQSELMMADTKYDTQYQLVKDDEGIYLKWIPVIIRRVLNYRRMVSEKLLMETMYRGLVDQFPAVTYLASVDSWSHLLYVSPQIEQLGYSCDSWLSDPNLRLHRVFEEDRPKLQQAFTRALDTDETFCCEYRMVANNGKLHWFRDEAMVIKSRDSQLLFFQGIMQNITDIKAMERELHQHRYFLEQRVKVCTEQLERRVLILESCNKALGNRLENVLNTCKELRKTIDSQKHILNDT